MVGFPILCKHRLWTGTPKNSIQKKGGGGRKKKQNKTKQLNILVDIVDLCSLEKPGLESWISFSLHVEISEKK